MWRLARIGIVTVTAVVAVAVSVTAGTGGGDGGAPARAWVGRHAGSVRDALTAVNTVPVDPRAAGPDTMATACARVRGTGESMRAALPAPDPRLTRAWRDVTDDLAVVAGFCLDAAARRDVTMLEEVPNYLALTGGAFERLRAVAASIGPSF